MGALWAETDKSEGIIHSLPFLPLALRDLISREGRSPERRRLDLDTPPS